MSKPSILLIMGGENSRFVPFNNRTYKAGIAVCGKPLIFRTLEKLEAAGYFQIVAVINPKDDNQEGLKEVLPEAFPNLHFEFVVQPKALGMGDAVLKAKDLVGEQFIVSSGYHDQLAEIADQMIAMNEPMVITATYTDRPWEYGILEMKGDRAVGIVEKPPKGKEPSNQKIQTMYLLNDDFLETLDKLPSDQYNFETALNKLMKKDSVAVHLTDNLLSLKYAWHLFDFQQHYFNQLESYRDASAMIAGTAIIDESQGPVYIGPGAEIGHATQIIGPAFIGAEVFIGSFSFIRSSSIEMGCLIGSSTEVARSIVMENSSIHFSYVADSIIGQGVKIGANIITANKRLDRESVPVTVKNQKIDTGRLSLGVLIGDQANVGIRVSTMPGVVIGHKATVFPGKILYTNVAPEDTSKP